jgi:uncharacterized protein YdeI (YjbR/CyaY-like superfamily)
LETFKDIKAVYAKTRKAWRQWLAKNHSKEKSVFLIVYHKASATSSVYYDEAVEEALCFGWIDSTRYKRDAESSYLYFARRRPGSKWSKLNKERVAKLIKSGLMTQHGQAFIDLAKEKGIWDAENHSEHTVMPRDLQVLLKKNKAAWKNYQAFPPSAKKNILGWIANAKRPETRQNRIVKAVTLAAKNIRAYP